MFCMKMIKRFIYFSVAASISLNSPMAFSQMQPNMDSPQMQALVSLQSDVSPFGMEVQLDYVNGKAYLVKPLKSKSATGNPGIEIPLENEAELKKYSPKNMKERLEKAMSTPQFSSAALHSLRRLPTESALFYLAIGAVMSTKLLTDFSANPNSLEQHNHHSLSPVGILSFYGFMVANGVTSNVLIAATRNPSLYSFIPYLGMTSGFFAQSAISMFASDPNVKACAKTLLYTSIKTSDEQVKKLVGESVSDPCEQAFNRYVLKKQLFTLAPGLVSMLGSTLLSGMITSSLTTVAKLKNIQFLLYVFPGGIQVKGLQAVVASTTQMALFVGLDTLFLNRYVTNKFNEIVSTEKLFRQEDSLSKAIVEKHQSNWSDSLTDESCSNKSVPVNCKKDLSFQLKEFSEMATQYRGNILAPTYEAHQGWSEYLGKLVTQFNATHDFYEAFIDQIREYKFNNTNNRLSMQYPLLGVKAAGLNPSKTILHHTNPKLVEPAQMDTIAELSTAISEIIAHKDQRKMNSMFNKEYQFLKSLQSSFSSNDTRLISAGIKNLQDMYHYYKNNYQEYRQQYSTDFNVELEYLVNNLGINAKPVSNFGEGFVETFRLFSTTADKYKDLQSPGLTDFTKAPSYFDYLVVQSACGKIASTSAYNDSGLISNGWGFPSKFNPPRITTDTDLGSSCWAITHNALMKSGVYTQKLPGATGFAEYSAKNILPQILGTAEDSGFEKWWSATSDKEIRKAFNVYQMKFGTIVQKLMIALRAENKDELNKADSKSASALSSKILVSLQQESRLYNMILGEIFKSAYKQSLGTEVDRKLLNSKSETVPAPRQYDFAPKSYYLLETFKNAAVFDLEKILSINTYGYKAQAKTSYALQLQAEIDYEFQKLVWFLMRLKVVPTTDGKSYLVQSTFENSEMEEQYKKFESKVQEFLSLMDVPMDSQDLHTSQSEALFKLNKEQLLIAKQAGELLLATGSEIAMYGTIINSVSWDKIQRLNDAQGNNKWQSLLNEKAKSINSSLSSRIGTKVESQSDE